MKAKQVEPLSSSAFKVRATIERGFKVLLADTAFSAEGERQLVKESIIKSPRHVCLELFGCGEAGCQG
jgi:hypothetical protein